jgi:hypothetical protein
MSNSKKYPIGTINKPGLGNLNTILNSLIQDIMSPNGETPEFLKLLEQIETGGMGNIPSWKYNVPPGFWSSSPTGPYLKGKEEFNPVKPIASDSGYYQFTRDSAKTAKQRAKNLGLDDAYINSLPSNPIDWPKEIQDVLALTNIAARSVGPGEAVEYFIDETGAQKYQGKKGSVNSLLANLLTDFDYTNPEDIEAFEDLYYTLHQTEPTKAVSNNLKNAMANRMASIITDENANTPNVPDITDIVKTIARKHFI